MKLSVSLFVLVIGCVPTLSAPRGAAHLAAMSEASRDYHHGRFPEAAAAFGEAARTAERRVDRDEALFAEARALRRLHHTQEALPILDEIAARRPFSRRTVRALFDSAILRLELGENQRAYADLSTIVHDHPDDGPSSRALRLLVAARRESPLQERLQYLRGLYAEVGTHDVGDDLLEAEAVLDLEAHDRPAAIATLERLVREHPYPIGERWDDALLRLSDLAEEDGHYQEAIAYLEQLLARRQANEPGPGSFILPTMPGARLRVARIYRDRLHDPDRAAQSFLATYQEYPRSTLRDDALYELGAMWLDAGRGAEGCNMLHRVMQEFEVGHARREAEARIERACPR